MASTPRTAAAPLGVTRQGRHAIAAATIGNILEIFDFVAYGIFAIPIAKTFFPAGSDLVSLILAFLTFGVGFLARPVGAFVLGAYADRVGRKNALSLTLLLMALGTLIPAICPSYASIGIAAPIIVVCGRLLQGFSAGGEIGGTVAMLVENAPPTRRGFYASFQQMTQGAGILLAGILGMILTTVFTQQQVVDGVWRIAFAFGLLIAPVGWYIRRSVEETPVFEAEKHRHVPVSIGTLVRSYWPGLLAGIGVMVFWTIATYVSNYLSTYAVRELKLTLMESYAGQLCYGITTVIACPLVGRLADRVGPHKPMFFGAGVAAIIAYPLFKILAAQPNVGMLIAVQVVIAILLSCYAAAASLVLARIFPTRLRATGVSLAYAVGVTVFGGFTPMIVTALIGATQDKLIVGVYLSVAALISCLTLWLAKRPADTELD